MQAPQHHPEAGPTYPCTLEKLYRYTMMDLPVRVGSDCATAEISNGSVDLPRVRGGCCSLARTDLPMRARWGATNWLQRTHQIRMDLPVHAGVRCGWTRVAS